MYEKMIQSEKSNDTFISLKNLAYVFYLLLCHPGYILVQREITRKVLNPVNEKFRDDVDRHHCTTVEDLLFHKLWLLLENVKRATHF